MIGEWLWFVSFIGHIDYLLYIMVAYEFINLYFAVLLFIRVKFFFYIDESKDLRKRENFKNYDSAPSNFLNKNFDKLDGNKIITDYVSFGSLNVIVSGVFLIYLGLYLLSNVGELLWVLFLLIIYMHLMLIPDYLNKVCIYDIRTQKGTYLNYGLLLLIFLAGAYIVQFLLL